MRLIDADALGRYMYCKTWEAYDSRVAWNHQLWIRYKIFEEALRDVPSIDAMPVIRCKDCKRNNTKYCPMIFVEMKPNDFCSYGERKENGK